MVLFLNGNLVCEGGGLDEIFILNIFFIFGIVVGLDLVKLLFVKREIVQQSGFIFSV